MEKDKITAESLFITEIEDGLFEEDLKWVKENKAILYNTLKSRIKTYAIKLAKHYVQAALEAATENVKLIKECGKESIAGCNAVFCNTCIDVVDKDSILTSYDLNEIK